MKNPNGRACAIIKAISCDVSETFLRCSGLVISRIVPAEGERMKVWQPRRVAANSQAQRRLAAPALLTILVAVIVVLASTYSRRSFSQQQSLTFNRDVAPIFYKHCRSEE